jgi:hydroxyethylthiazole kinase
LIRYLKSCKLINPAKNNSTVYQKGQKEIKMSILAEKAAQNLKLLRQKKPLVHNITNLVVMNVTANALLSMGASPVMAHARDEVREMVTLAGALVLNIGTLSEEWVTSMLIAGEKASQLNIPVVLDPVGSGATVFRTASAQKLIEKINIHVIRGNPSEILSLRHEDSRTRGVDSLHTVDDATMTSKVLAKQLNTTLAVTGPTDIVTDGTRIVRILNGHPLMGRITGSGCMATATIAAFLTVDADALSAAATALSFFGLAGEIAGGDSDGPGTFMVRLLDALYLITPEVLEKRARIIES